MHSAALLLALVATFTSTNNAATVQAGAAVSGVVSPVNTAVSHIRNQRTEPPNAVHTFNNVLQKVLPIFKSEIDAVISEAEAAGNAALAAAANNLKNVYVAYAGTTAALLKKEPAARTRMLYRDISDTAKDSNKSLTSGLAALLDAAKGTASNAVAVVESGIESTETLGTIIVRKLVRPTMT